MMSSYKCKGYLGCFIKFYLPTAIAVITSVLNFFATFVQGVILRAGDIRMYEYMHSSARLQAIKHVVHSGCGAKS